MNDIRVGLVSDSHGHFAALEKMTATVPAVDAWIHCGDYCEDADDLAVYTDRPVYVVRGNNDYLAPASVPEYGVVSFGDVPIVAVHGHQWYGAERMKGLLALGEEKKALLVVFGHTHRRFMTEQHGITLVNPGSVALPRDGCRGTFAVALCADGILKDIRFYEI